MGLEVDTQKFKTLLEDSPGLLCGYLYIDLSINPGLYIYNLGQLLGNAPRLRYETLGPQEIFTTNRFTVNFASGSQ